MPYPVSYTHLDVYKRQDPQYGARPLNRAIQKYIEDPLAEFILSESPEAGAVLEADLNEDKTKLTIMVHKEAAS